MCHNIVKLVAKNEFISGVNIIHVPVLININSHPHFPKNIGVGRPTINTDCFINNQIMTPVLIETLLICLI